MNKDMNRETETEREREREREREMLELISSTISTFMSSNLV